MENTSQGARRECSMMNNLVCRLVRFACVVLPLAPGQSAASPAAASQSPETALQAYVDGLRTGSLAKLQELFLADGQFCSVVRQPPSQITCRKFSEVLGSWVEQPDPAAKGRILKREDATPSMSTITYELSFAGTRYLDQLLLYRVEGRWYVVAKTTAVQ
jgi:hypothetical protein